MKRLALIVAWGFAFAAHGEAFRSFRRSATSSVVASTSSVPTLTYEVDFTAQTTQSFPSDGDYTIDGKTWKLTGRSGATTMVLTNGTGIVMTTNTTEMKFSARLTNLFPTIDPRAHHIRFWVYFTGATLPSNFAWAAPLCLFNYDMAGSWLILTGPRNASDVSPGSHWLVYVAGAPASSNGVTSTNLTDTVSVVDMDSPTQLYARSGVYSTGWPAETDLRWRGMPASQGLPSSAWDPAITFDVQASGTSQTIKRLKIEVF